LRVDQKKWSVYKTDKQKKINDGILKKMFLDGMLFY
jgi:hypothetical protein